VWQRSEIFGGGRIGIDEFVIIVYLRPVTFIGLDVILVTLFSYRPGRGAQANSVTRRTPRMPHDTVYPEEC